MEVLIFGPNLRDQSKGDFIVHALGCRDCSKLKGEYVYQMEIDNKFDVVEFLYADMIEEDDEFTYTVANSGIHFAPCVTLPEGGE